MTSQFPAAVEVGFGEGRELGTLHGEIGAAAHHLDGERFGRRFEGVAEAAADGMAEADVGDEAGAEEGLDPVDRAVDELIDDDEGAGGQFLAERTAGAHGEDIGDAGAFQGVDVGREIDGAGGQAVAAAVARQEDHGLAVQVAKQKLVRGLAEGRGNTLPARVVEAVDLVNAAAADNADDGRHARLRHDRNLPGRLPTAPSVSGSPARFNRQPRATGRGCGPVPFKNG